MVITTATAAADLCLGDIVIVIIIVVVVVAFVTVVVDC